MLTHHFRPRAKYTEFAETDMKGRAREGAVRLFDNDDVDRTGEGRGVYLVVEETEVADDLGDIVHTVHVLSPRHYRSRKSLEYFFEIRGVQTSSRLYSVQRFLSLSLSLSPTRKREQEVLRATEDRDYFTSRGFVSRREVVTPRRRFSVSFVLPFAPDDTVR